MRHPLMAALPLALSCATASPRFSQELAASFAEDDMRRLETDELEIYYPAVHREAAERIARRASQCLTAYRKRQTNDRPRGRGLLFLTSANFNNAYVTGLLLGEPLHSVNPLQTNLELLHWYGLSGADTGDVSCHEMLHSAHFEQAEGFWHYLNAVTGPVFSPQVFSERWFTEGVAQYYEGRIERSVGRPHSPIYRGSFDSFVDSRGGSIGPGDLNTNQRELSPFNGAYFTSLPFVEWLVARSGEEALWDLMNRQGKALFAPFAVSLRFSDVYGKALGELVDEWSRELARTHVARVRPSTQRVLRERVGQLARIAVHAPTGAIALVSTGNDEPPMLRVLEKDGTERVKEHLVQLRPFRERVLVGPVTMSGLSFSADGKLLFLMNEDLIARGDTRTQLWKIDAVTGETLRIWQGIARGQGGAIAPDGKRYVFIDFMAGRSRLASFDLETERVTTLFEPPPGVALSAPALSGDGTRIVFSRLDRAGWNVWLREADGTVRALTNDGQFNYGAKWIDEQHVSIPRVHAGRLQVHRLAVDTLRLERLTDAPWALLDAWPTQGDLVFVNREGTQWSIDRAPADVLEVIKEGTLVAQAPESDVQTDAPAPPLVDSTPEPMQEAPPIRITSDEPYSGLDHLFLPQLRVPGITTLPVSDGTSITGWTTTLYGSISGKDRLSRHNWGINATVAWPNRPGPFQFTAGPLQWTASAEYVNQQLAPWAIGVSGFRDALNGGAFWSAAVSGSRSFFTVPISFAVRGLVNETFDSSGPSFLQKYIGPEVSVFYSATESTAYGGAHRHFSVSTTARAYPIFLGSDRSMVDLSARVGFGIPLPLTRRHTLVGSIQGRWLPGAPAASLLLGGQPQGFPVFQSPTSVDPPQGPRAYLPGSLAEAVRGYDDFSIRSEGAAIGAARYRFVFPIDRGTASILWIFPSFFARQLEVEGFGAAAVSLQGQWLRSAGGQASFRFTLMDLIPLTVSYQFAWRFDFNRGGLHTVALSVE